MICAPGIAKPGSVSDHPVVSTDFYPTLLDLTGLELKPKQHLDGISLRPVLEGKPPLNREAIYWHYPHYSNQGGFPGGAVRMGDWKFIERLEDGRVHLFNLKEDLGERQDVAEKHPERVETMRKKLHAWYKTVDAKFLRAKPNGPEPYQPL